MTVHIIGPENYWAWK